jgi:hypothetical protein
MLKIRAVKNPPTLNPGTKSAAKSITRALITKVNKPSVRIFIGRVRKRRTGLINAFNKPKTKAATSADEKLDITTPGSMYPAITIAKALISQFMIILILSGSQV